MENLLLYFKNLTDVQIEQFSKLEAGMPVFLGGDKWVRVDETLAAAFQPGDSLAVSPKTGQPLEHSPHV